MGLNVISCEELAETDADRSNIIILCSRNDKNRESIRNQLIRAGYSNENIQNYDLLIKDRIMFEKEEFEKEHPYVLKNIPKREENAKKMCEKFEKEGIAFIEKNIDQNDFVTWRNHIEYGINYKRYVEIFGTAIESKIFQHYMSLKLLDIQPGKTLVDIASSASVFPNIVKKEYTDIVYRQDLCYETGIHGDKIGSLASDIPLENL